MLTAIFHFVSFASFLMFALKVFFTADVQAQTFGNAYTELSATEKEYMDLITESGGIQALLISALACACAVNGVTPGQANGVGMASAVSGLAFLYMLIQEEAEDVGASVDNAYAAVAFHFILAVLCLAKGTGKPHKESQGDEALHMIFLLLCAATFMLWVLSYVATNTHTASFFSTYDTMSSQAQKLLAYNVKVNGISYLTTSALCCTIAAIKPTMAHAKHLGIASMAKIAWLVHLKANGTAARVGLSPLPLYFFLAMYIVTALVSFTAKSAVVETPDKKTN
eukprot:m.977808 g.977808  ORF g.977808 m.977808 type:complete len:282 (-) comp23954_c1_seq17:709-1554(-)